MAESRLHLELVACLSEWLRTCEYLGSDTIVFADSPDSTRQDIPFMIGAYRPDVFAQSRKFDRQIIGEAKTPRDLETPRSKRQLEAFLLESSKNENSAFILATQWDYVRYSASILRQMSGDLGLLRPKYAILDQFGSLSMSSHDWI